MKEKTKELLLDLTGVEEASETVQTWLQEAGAKRRDIIRLRMAVEELATDLCRHGEGQLRAEFRFFRRFGRDHLRIRYGGEKYDPTAPSGGEMEEFTARILAQTGITPTWRWRDGQNELLFRMAGKRHPQLEMPGCVVLAVAVDLLDRDRLRTE